MSEWLSQAFSGGVSLARVNPLGIVLMLAAVILSVLAGPVSKRCSDERRDKVKSMIKIVSLFLVCIGAAVAMI